MSSLINQLNATTDYYWLQVEPVDILNKASALLWKLIGNAITLSVENSKFNWQIQPHEIVDGGLMVKIPLEYASSNRGGYGAQTVISQSKVDIIDAARFKWGGIYASNSLNLDDLTQNTGEEAIIALTEKYMQSIIKSARVQMAEDILRSTLSDVPDIRINGLGDLFSTTTSRAYGALKEDDMADWKANVITASEPIAFDVLQKMWRTPNMGNVKGLLPDFVITTQTLADGYERSLHPQQRYEQSDMVQAGWNNVLHKGAPVVGDPYITSGYLYALNLNFLMLRSHKDYNFTKPVWVDKTVLGQPDDISANTRWRGNLYCSNRKMQVLHTGLQEPY